MLVHADALETKHKNSAKQHVIPIFDVPTESVQRALIYCRSVSVVAHKEVINVVF